MSFVKNHLKIIKNFFEQNFDEYNKVKNVFGVIRSSKYKNLQKETKGLKYSLKSTLKNKVNQNRVTLIKTYSNKTYSVYWTQIDIKLKTKTKNEINF